jgi:hypothetical protein
MVVDRAEPGETFVAQFGEDWEAQLAPESTALEAALQHLDPGGSTILGEL